MGMPWLHTELETVDWYFRLSGSAAVECIALLAGLTVERQGALLTIESQTIWIGSACSGLSTLQAMIIAGALAAYVSIKNEKTYWLHLPMVIVAAWIANTGRIILITVVSFAFGADAVKGPSYVTGHGSHHHCIFYFGNRLPLY